MVQWERVIFLDLFHLIKEEKEFKACVRKRGKGAQRINKQQEEGWMGKDEGDVEKLDTRGKERLPASKVAGVR